MRLVPEQIAERGVEDQDLSAAGDDQDPVLSGGEHVEEGLVRLAQLLLRGDARTHVTSAPSERRVAALGSSVGDELEGAGRAVRVRPGALGCQRLAHRRGEQLDRGVGGVVDERAANHLARLEAKQRAAAIAHVGDFASFVRVVEEQIGEVSRERLDAVLGTPGAFGGLSIRLAPGHDQRGKEQRERQQWRGGEELVDGRDLFPAG